MVWSLVALLVIIGMLLVFNRGCSFSPGGPTIDPTSAPTVDLEAVLPGRAKAVDFGVRLPAVPQGWAANSSSTGAVPPASVVVRVGWLTPGRFVQLSQSGAEGVELVRVETALEEPVARGRVDVGGTEWTVYGGRRDEAVWAADLGDARVVITGTGTEEEFRVLAEGVGEAKPLPRE
jgi:hypothetical protein